MIYGNNGMVNITIIIPRYGKTFTLTPIHFVVFCLLMLFSISGCLYAYTFSGKNTKHAPDAMAANNNDKALLLLATKIGILSAKLENLEQLSLRLGKEAGLKVQVQNEAPGLGGPLLHAQTPRNAELEDLLASIEARLANKAEELSWIEDYLMAQKALKGMLPWQTPMENFQLSSGFGWRIDPITGKKAFHPGLDFATHRGNAVLAAAHGTVIQSGYEKGYGLSIILEHANGIKTRYAHLSKAFVKAGDIIKAGQKIGAAGSTGRSTGTHLHFEVLRHNHPLDPERFLFSEK
jgi:murein DD-endopeptidase MepM/ murein hydrolase activator NlpD